MNDDEPKLTIGEFHDRCAKMFGDLADMLENFDDDTDPAGIASAIVARFIVHYLDADARGL